MVVAFFAVGLSIFLTIFIYTCFGGGNPFLWRVYSSKQLNKLRDILTIINASLTVCMLVLTLIFIGEPRTAAIVAGGGFLTVMIVSILFYEIVHINGYLTEVRKSHNAVIKIAKKHVETRSFEKVLDDYIHYDYDITEKQARKIVYKVNKKYSLGLIMEDKRTNN